MLICQQLFIDKTNLIKYDRLINRSFNGIWRAMHEIQTFRREFTDHKKSKGNETAGAGRPNRYQYAEPVQD